VSEENKRLVREITDVIWNRRGLASRSLSVGVRRTTWDHP
jgi:hypothetical protein